MTRRNSLGLINSPTLSRNDLNSLSEREGLPDRDGEVGDLVGLLNEEVKVDNPDSSPSASALLMRLVIAGIVWFTCLRMKFAPAWLEVVTKF